MIEPSDSNGAVDAHYRTIRKAEVTQSDVAKARRNIRERKETYVSMNDELYRQMQNAASTRDFDKFQEVAASANRLKEFGSQIDNEEKELEQIIGNAPSKRQGRISDDVKTEIHNLYHAGVSNQTQLANEYQVSQATVNTIVNDDPLKYRRKKCKYPINNTVIS